MNFNKYKLRSNLTDNKSLFFFKLLTELQTKHRQSNSNPSVTAISLDYMQTTNVELYVGLEPAQFLLNVHFSCKNLVV